MRPEELQIGDWVYSLIDSGGKVVREPQMIRGIWTDSDGDEDVCTIKTDRSDVWYPIETFEPIPITPAILEKNGFRLGSDGWLWFPDEGNEEQDYIFIQFRKGCKEIRRCELCFFKKAQIVFRIIQYIHQLQQAMRLCGIEKEITLN